MTYASQDDLVTRYGAYMVQELTDRADPPAGAIDAAVVSHALDDADAVIDGYLKGRYVLPLAVTPRLVRDLAQAIAIYKLHRDAVSEKVRREYEDAISSLKQSRTLRHMEGIREQCYEASPREVKRLDAEYGRCWKAIEPYVNGSKPYTEARSSGLDAAAWASLK